MGIFRSNSEVGKPIRTWPQRLNAILQSFCEALGINMDQPFTGPQVLPMSAKGAPNGVCDLDGNAMVPMSRLPVSVTSAPNVLPLTNAQGKIDSSFIPSAAASYISGNFSRGSLNPGQEGFVTISNVSGSWTTGWDGTRIVLPANTLLMISIAIAMNVKGIVTVYPFEDKTMIALPMSAGYDPNLILANSGSFISLLTLSSSKAFRPVISVMQQGMTYPDSYLQSVDSRSHFTIVRL